MPRKTKRSVLTADQQNHHRAKLMVSAGKIVSQLDQYIKDGFITVAGKEHMIDNTRLAAYRLVLDRTVPTISASEITHRSENETLSTEDILGKLMGIAAKKPELAAKLQEVIGGRIIQGERVVQGDDAPRSALPQIEPREPIESGETEQ